MKTLAAPAILFTVLAFCNLPNERNSTSNSNDPNPPSNTAEPAALDREGAKNELLRLINEIADAAAEGDRTLLDDRTTDDFQLTDVEGRVLDKQKALAEVRKETSIKSWVITEAELRSLTDDSAVMTFLITLTGTNNKVVKARVTDTFSKIDGRWLLKSEQQTLLR
ncbi:MAG: nuclear transport factor 2 family protein [Pyrinomonadaceae bacterium]